MPLDAGGAVPFFPRVRHPLSFWMILYRVFVINTFFVTVGWLFKREGREDFGYDQLRALEIIQTSERNSPDDGRSRVAAGVAWQNKLVLMSSGGSYPEIPSSVFVPR